MLHAYASHNGSEQYGLFAHHISRTVCHEHSVFLFDVAHLKSAGSRLRLVDVRSIIFPSKIVELP